MKSARRLTTLLLLAVFLSPIIIAWRYPDRGHAFLMKAVNKYRKGISGELVIADIGLWRKVGPGMHLRRLKVLRGKEFFKLHLLAARMDPNLYDFRVVTVPLDRIAETPITAVAHTSGAEAVINGSFYNAELGILGLAISDGKQISAQTYSGENRGIFFVRNGHPSLSHRDRFSSAGATQAIQSGPWLVSQGKAEKVFKQPGNVNRRSAICEDAQGRIIFVVTDTMISGISLPHFAQALAKPEPVGLDCKSALNLDGGTSSQMLLWGKERRDLVRGFVNVPVYIAAIPKKRTQ